MKSNTQSTTSVGIITLFHNSQNYGGVLQAYALQKVISDMGYSVEQIRYHPSSYDSNKLSFIIQVPKKFVTMLISAIENRELTEFSKKLIRFSFFCTEYPSRVLARTFFLNSRRQLRTKKFDAFNSRYIPSSKEYTPDSIHTSADFHDIFVTGSDQVWNPNWFHAPYYLNFVPDNKPKIAYAASTAVPSLNNKQYEKMQPLVSRMNHISVREKNAVEMLESMTTEKIEWVLDPTLLLTACEWDTISKKRHVEKPYIFAYILGDNKANRQCVKKFAKEKGLPVVICPFVGTQKLWQLRFGDLHCYGGPDAFVSLVRDAEYVLTDSFHGVVFSTIYQKKFVVLKRHADCETGAMNERLYSLFQITGMDKQLVSPDDPELTSKIENICYDGVGEMINEWRKKSVGWLKEALEDERYIQTE